VDSVARVMISEQQGVDCGLHMLSHIKALSKVDPQHLEEHSFPHEGYVQCATTLRKFILRDIYQSALDINSI
jgi:hypothetical protein